MVVARKLFKIANNEKRERFEAEKRRIRNYEPRSSKETYLTQELNVARSLLRVPFVQCCSHQQLVAEALIACLLHYWPNVERQSNTAPVEVETGNISEREFREQLAANMTRSQ